MHKYQDCQRCRSPDGERVFQCNQLDVWAWLCEECYELCVADKIKQIMESCKEKLTGMRIK